MSGDVVSGARRALKGGTGMLEGVARQELEPLPKAELKMDQSAGAVYFIRIIA